MIYKKLAYCKRCDTVNMDDGKTCAMCEKETLPLVVVGEKEYMDSAASYARTKLLSNENFGEYISRRIHDVFNDLAGEAGNRMAKEYGEDVPAGALAFELMKKSVQLEKAWNEIVAEMVGET